MVSLLQDIIKKSLLDIWSLSVDGSTIVFTNPEDTRFGDLTCNIAFILAKRLKKSPPQIAQELAERLEKNLPKEFSKVEAVSGYINYTYSSEYFKSQLISIIQQGEKYGSPTSDQLPATSIQIEFVSANPTGPLHIGNARGGPIGDVLANVLEKVGCQVEREYYHNDVGGQVERLGQSVYFRYLELSGRKIDFPQDGYQGDYVIDLAQLIKDADGDKWLSCPQDQAVDYFGKWATDYYLAQALSFCQNLGIRFDHVYKESEIASSGWTKKAIAKLDESGVLKEKDGAIWLASHDEFLADRESVVTKSDGSYSYFSNDIGYHWEKFNRGFDLVIDVWGANHHGHVTRMKSAMRSLGISPDRLEIILYQWVSLVSDGEKISMSKRSGNFFLAKELLDEIGPDAFRFYFLSRGAEKPLELDTSLAKEQSNKNPVFYVQYAHARLCRLLEKTAEAGFFGALAVESSFSDPSELDLIRQLLVFPSLVREISLDFAVNKLTSYAVSLADSFHRFYESCSILGAKSASLSNSRTALAKAAKITLKNTLDLLAVRAPEEM